MPVLTKVAESSESGRGEMDGGRCPGRVLHPSFLHFCLLESPCDLLLVLPK